jgi:2-alkyl-3-oxoalkanoate reductase
MGAEPVVLDVLDREAVFALLRRVRPEVVVHEATALAAFSGNPRKFEQEFALTNRLRSEGTDNLLAAAREVGAQRLVAQSYAGWPYAREGGPVKSEDDPLDPNPPAAMRSTFAAIRHLEAAVTGATDLEGIVVRYGAFYGPGTSLAPAGAHAELIRRRRFPIVGDGQGVCSFVHIDDVATATLAAIERGRRGIYNIVDDDPAPIAEWLPALAAALGAKPPRHAPVWLARLIGGEQTVVVMTQIRGASNAKAKRKLGWRPRYPSWREGFCQALGDREARNGVESRRGSGFMPWLVRWLNAKLLSPPTLVALRLGVAPQAFALLETVGRRSGKRRLTPVGNGLIGSTFWLVAQRGLRAAYVCNLRANPRARVKVGRRWYSGTAHLEPDDDWSRRLDLIGEALGPARRLDARLLRWFIRVLQTRPVTLRIDLDR